MHQLVRNNRVLWTIQGLLAALFLFAGGYKLFAPADQLAAAAPGMPVLFLRFIATMEILGAIGLILPGILDIRRELTPLAASGLVIIMIGAVVVTALTVSAVGALFPLVVGILAVTVAYGRSRSSARLPQST
jgi:DoxX-like family